MYEIKGKVLFCTVFLTWRQTSVANGLVTDGRETVDTNLNCTC